LTKTIINKKNIYYLLLILNSFAFVFYSGGKGVFPIDSFFHYDAGFHILNGNHPFKDYWLISGPLLDYMQSFIFYIFGVKWSSYVVHAAILNSFISIICFYFFIKIGLDQIFSFIYSLGVSILAYTSISSPFVDHHAVIFCLASVCFFILAIIYNKYAYWACSSFLLILSFFSKQIPSSYMALVAIPILATYFYIFFKKENLIKSMLFYFFGGFIPIAMIFIFFLLNEISLKNFIIQYLLYPMTIGENRLSNMDFNFNNVINQFKFLYLSLIPLLIVIFCLFKKKKKNIIVEKDIFVLSVIILSSVVFIYSQLITKNQILIFFLIPFFLGISHCYIKKYKYKDYFLHIILLILIIATTKYHVRFGVERKFLELQNINLNLSKNAEQIDRSLSGIDWITRRYPTNPQKEINFLIEVKKILNKDNKKKILITDYQFLASVTNDIEVSPNKFYDIFSVPHRDNKYFVYYKKFFLEQIKKRDIENIYVVGKNEKKYVFDFFEEKSCIKSTKINEILTLVNLTDCKI